jgi:hypothetical protein
MLTTRSRWIITHLQFYRYGSELLQKLTIAGHIPSGRSALIDLEFELRRLYDIMVTVEHKVILVRHALPIESRGHPFFTMLYPWISSTHDLDQGSAAQLRHKRAFLRELAAQFVDIQRSIEAIDDDLAQAQQNLSQYRPSEEVLRREFVLFNIQYGSEEGMDTALQVERNELSNVLLGKMWELENQNVVFSGVNSQLLWLFGVQNELFTSEVVNSRFQ